ncbi:MAG: hypothetical protein U5R49_13385 [Deltaproteobacteria bacterium]|nr:hypothetical protein [Deltaproteobacteria bacterium]
MNDWAIVDYWMEKAREDLASARDNHASGRYQNAVWGKHYDWLFDNRHKADYRPLVQFNPHQVMSGIEGTSAFVEEMNDFLVMLGT